MNKVVHFELPAEDMERAKKFYEGVFGWKVEPVIPDYSMAYTQEVDDKFMPKEAGAINGGIQKRDDILKTPTIVLEVDNIEEKLKEAEDAGAKIIMQPIDVMGRLIHARILDTEGNIVGIIQNKSN